MMEFSYRVSALITLLFKSTLRRNLPFPVAILSISGIMQVCAMVRLGIEGLSVNLFLGMVISNFQCAEMLLTSLRLERSAAGML